MTGLKNSDTTTEKQVRDLSNRIRFLESVLVPIGGIMLFGGELPPDGWLLCDGGGYNIEKYPRLYRVTQSPNVPNLSAVSGYNYYIRTDHGV